MVMLFNIFQKGGVFIQSCGIGKKSDRTKAQQTEGKKIILTLFFYGKKYKIKIKNKVKICYEFLGGICEVIFYEALATFGAGKNITLHRAEDFTHTNVLQIQYNFM